MKQTVFRGSLRFWGFGVLGAISVFLSGCESSPQTQIPPAGDSTSNPAPTVSPIYRTPIDSEGTESRTMARVEAVTVSGEPGNYTFSVTIASPDTGCDQYADWWEVISPEGTLIYRRVLAHSHVDEQPFNRTGGPVSIDPDQVVIVRAHMHPGGYDTQAQQGTASTGFAEVALEEGFAADAAQQEPLPQGCAF